jgi:hypothetical protein
MERIHTSLFEISYLLQSAIDLPVEERTYYVENVLNEIRRGALPGLLDIRKSSKMIREEIQSRTCHSMGEPWPEYDEMIAIRTTALLEKIPVDHPVYEECMTILAFYRDKPPTWDHYKMFLNDCNNSLFLVELHDKFEGTVKNVQTHLQAIKKRLLELQPTTPEPPVVNVTRKHYRISEEARAVLLASVAETIPTNNSTNSTSSSSMNSATCN